MAAPVKKKTGLDEIELHPDAWTRFEKFVDTKVRTTAAPTAKRKPSRPKATSRKARKKA